jgi:uridine monophosphate synthetase
MSTMTWHNEKQELMREVLSLLYQHRMVRTFYRDKPEGWTLISGLYSPLYVQLRPLSSHPHVFETVCRAMARMLREEAPEVNRIIGIAMAGVPLAAGMGLLGGFPSGFTRKMEGVKTVDRLREVIGSYGEHALIEGELVSGDCIALVDDLVTRFDSKLIALEQAKHEAARRGLQNIRCDTVAVVLDREQGGQESARSAGVSLISLIPLKTAGLDVLREVLHPEEWDVINRYLQDSAPFQDRKVQEDLARRAKTHG